VFFKGLFLTILGEDCETWNHMAMAKKIFYYLRDITKTKKKKKGSFRDI
jgi:hypothetical protein